MREMEGKTSIRKQEKLRWATPLDVENRGLSPVVRASNDTFWRETA